MTSLATLIVLAFIILLNFVLHLCARLKIKRLSRQVVAVSKLNHELPVGARISYLVYTGNNCLRCKVGRIIQRKRFKVCSIREGTVVRELSGTFHCKACNYRGLNLIN